MRIVMVTKFVPAPANSGGKRRSRAIVEELAKVGRVTLCAFEDESADPGALEQMGIEVRSVPWEPKLRSVARGLARGSVSAARFYDRGLARAIADATARDTDHLQIEYTQLAAYARVARARRRFLDMHNVESALAASYAAGRPRLARAPFLLEASALRRMERRVLATFDLTSVVSEADLRLLPSQEKTVVAPNGWNPTPDPLPPAGEPVASFVALMGWPPNDDAARWLCGEIWPLVVRALPEAKLLLVGRDPSRAVRACESPSVHVTGTVPDVTAYLRLARIGLAPLRAGGGSRLKVLESLDAGRPVVATTKGVEGLEDLVGNGVVVADEPPAMARAVVELLADPARAEALGKTGRAAVAVAAASGWSTNTIGTW
jgi:glycosyltransferase involved in cell wall biosynthesis